MFEYRFINFSYMQTVKEKNKYVVKPWRLGKQDGAVMGDTIYWQSGGL
jgi:hypothetical protein